VASTVAGECDLYTHLRRGDGRVREPTASDERVDGLPAEDITLLDTFWKRVKRSQRLPRAVWEMFADVLRGELLVSIPLAVSALHTLAAFELALPEATGYAVASLTTVLVDAAAFHAQNGRQSDPPAALDGATLTSPVLVTFVLLAVTGTTVLASLGGIAGYYVGYQLGYLVSSLAVAAAVPLLDDGLGNLSPSLSPTISIQTAVLWVIVGLGLLSETDQSFATSMRDSLVSGRRPGGVLLRARNPRRRR
jgi:hypothetical protein